MAYMDVFVMPVQKAREQDYMVWAELACKVWMEHGALSYIESRAEDVPMGKLTSFPRAVQLEPDEVLYLGFATYRDRAHRDAVMEKTMNDSRLSAVMADSPANMTRMIYGGFETLVSS